jgi:hypothetical protein
LAKIGFALGFGDFTARGCYDLVEKSGHGECLNYTGRMKARGDRGAFESLATRALPRYGTGPPASERAG